MTQSLIRALPLMIAAMFLVPLGDSAGRLLGAFHGVNPLFTAWSRFALGFLVLAPFAFSLSALQLLKDWRIWLRAVFLICGITSILMALRTEPLANVFGVFFVGPILSYFLSAIFLREPITLMRTALLLAGFFGVVMVVDPRFGLTPGIGFALLAGCFYGAYLTASRWLTEMGRPRELLITQLLIGAVALMPVGIRHWPEMSGEIALYTGVSALGSAFGNLLLIGALGMAPASRLAPFVYIQLIAATMFGYLIFSEIPQNRALLGLAVILTSGLATLFLRERR